MVEKTRQRLSANDNVDAAEFIFRDAAQKLFCNQLHGMYMQLIAQGQRYKITKDQIDELIFDALDAPGPLPDVSNFIGVGDVRHDLNTLREVVRHARIHIGVIAPATNEQVEPDHLCKLIEREGGTRPEIARVAVEMFEHALKRPSPARGI